jgi:hypothetical protein
MRDLSTSEYTAKVQDGDEVHEIYYRRPGNDEIAAYQASLFERKGNKLIPKAAQARLKFGARIIIGFKKGTFGFGGKFIASDPKDSDYREDWKKLLVDKVPDIVSAVGRHAFEGTNVMEESRMEIANADDFLELFEEESNSDPSQ